MTDDEQKFLAEQIGLWQNLLQLDHWEICLSTDPTDQEKLRDRKALAVSKFETINYHSVILAFHEDWPKWSNQTLAETICHELIHCHLHLMHDRLKKQNSLYEGEDAQALAEEWTEYSLEQAVDSLTRAFIQTLKNASAPDPAV